MPAPADLQSCKPRAHFSLAPLLLTSLHLSFWCTEFGRTETEVGSLELLSSLCRRKGEKGDLEDCHGVWVENRIHSTQAVIGDRRPNRSMGSCGELGRVRGRL